MLLITEIDPSNEEHFPGITAMKEELQDWQWIYGKTPRFSVTFSTTLSSKDISVKITSYHGLIEDTDIHCDDKTVHILFTNLVTGLKGTRFNAGAIEISLVTYVNSASLTALDRQLCSQFVQWIVSVL